MAVEWEALDFNALWHGLLPSFIGTYVGIYLHRRIYENANWMPFTYKKDKISSDMEGLIYDKGVVLKAKELAAETQRSHLMAAILPEAAKKPPVQNSADQKIKCPEIPGSEKDQAKTRDEEFRKISTRLGLIDNEKDSKMSDLISLKLRKSSEESE